MSGSAAKGRLPATAKGAVGGPGTVGDAVPPRKMAPPDGGWGWWIVFAYALHNIMALPLLQSFGLIFKDRFRQMNMAATDCTIIINTNLAFTFGLGLLNGPLLRRFSFRKVALTGSIFLFSGTLLTGFASTFTQFVIFYSFLVAMGICFLAASFSLAMNSYFYKLRGRATGLCVASMGLGPIIMPFLISYLLNEYGVQGTMLVMAGLVLHSLVASLLLQPVTWHKRPVPNVEGAGKGLQTKESGKEANEEEREFMLHCGPHAKGAQGRKKSMTALSVEHDLDAHSIYGCEDPLVSPSIAERSYRRGSSASVHEQRRRYNRSVSQDAQQSRNYWWTSVDTINLGSSYMIFDERSVYAQHEATEEEAAGANGVCAVGTKRSKIFKRAAMTFAKFFDLDLLKDPIYVCIMIGISAAIFGELNFSVLTPFILSDFGLSTKQVARIMSTTASVDIVFRFMVPFIAERFKIHPRLMYMSSLILVISSRSFLLFFNSYYSVIGIAVFLGISKGVRTVYTSLIIPTYVPLEKLPGASGIQMLVNGLVFTACGPLIGVLRDYTGSYATCLYFINGMALFTVILWTLEYSMSRKGFQHHV